MPMQQVRFSKLSSRGSRPSKKTSCTRTMPEWPKCWSSSSEICAKTKMAKAQCARMRSQMPIQIEVPADKGKEAQFRVNDTIC